MKANSFIFVCLLAGCAAQQCVPARDSAGRIARNSAAVADFKRLHPCPANGATSGSCPGYIVDHIKPLCACGADDALNMQWQDVASAKLKDRDERKHCNLKKLKEE